jgi:hypothetical protein
MLSSLPKAGLLNSKFVGSRVAVGSGILVGVEVTVGGKGVWVGGSWVSVGRGSEVEACTMAVGWLLADIQLVMLSTISAAKANRIYLRNIPCPP